MEKEQTTKILKEQYVPCADFYSQIIDSLQDYSVFTVNKDLSINSWNSGAKNIFQYEADEILGLPFETIFTLEDRKNEVPQKEIEIALKNGRSTDIRWHLCKDGKTFFADGLVFPLKSVDDELLGFVKILRDITARKLSEDAIKKYAKDLEDLNLHKETVLAILSHDLRSPLAGIIQGAEYLKNNYDKIEPELAKNLLQEFYNASVNELDMLDYLVEWARVKYASDVFVPSEIKLVDCVQKVFEILKETASIKSLELINLIKTNYKVYADEKMVLSIIQNIVSNAIKYSLDGGKISISANKINENMKITIQDDGIGMSSEKQNKLFSPHIQSLSKAMEDSKGAGIGLLLVKGFLEKNGGKIWVESTLGKGTKFHFTLPISENKNI